MKHFFLFVILLEFALINEDNLNISPKGRPILNFMKKLKQKIKNTNTLIKVEVRHLDDQNVTNTDEESSIYDTSKLESDNLETSIPTAPVSTNPTVPTIPNSTSNSTQRDESPIYIPLEPIKPGPPTTTVPKVESDSNEKSLELKGFGNFKNKKTKENNDVLTWFTYFKFYSGLKPTIIEYKITITIYIRRRLEEKIIDKIAKCILVGDSNDFLQYDCSSEVEEGVNADNIGKVALEPEPVFTLDGQEAKGNNVTLDMQAVAEAGNLVEVVEDNHKNFLLPYSPLYFGSLDISKPPKFYLRNAKLSHTDSSSLRGLDDSTIKTGKYNFRFFDNYIKEEKNYSCYISNNPDGKTYDLECDATIPFNATLNDRLGFGDEEKNLNKIVKLQNDNYRVHFTAANRSYYRQNSSGLSGGAIAGIVAVTIVALVAISLLILFVRRKYKEPKYQEQSTSALEVNPMDATI
jgi:hypothetical protein